MRKEDEEEDYLDDSKSPLRKDLAAYSVILTSACFSTKTPSIPQNAAAPLR